MAGEAAHLPSRIFTQQSVQKEGNKNMPKMRAKMKVVTIESSEYGDLLKMEAVCKKEPYGEDGLDEDNTFARYTPIGQVTLTINNPALIGQFKPGQKFYIDFTEAPE